MAAAAGGGAAGEGSLRALYRWVDAVPLSRPRRNIARDFSDGVLVAEVVKFFFPAMVQLHSFVPASSTPQKLANWGHLNRKVLSKLNFSVPNEVIRQIVQCRPGVVEQVLLLLRQKIEEKQKLVKAVPGPGQELGLRAAQEISYLETGEAGCSKVRSAGGGCTQETPPAVGGNESRRHCAPTAGGDAAAIRLQLAEREQALLLAQETVQILQLKVRRLEQLLRLKDTRIDELSRRLQQTQQQQCCAHPHPHHGPEPPLSPTITTKPSELRRPMAAANKGSKAKAGAVRFAPSQPSEGNPGHVHFDEKLRDSAVMVTQERDGHVLVKVGFLKILHRYEITFLLPPSQRLGKDVCALPLPNPNLKVLTVAAVPEGYSVTCEYTAHKEGVLREEMLLASETGDGSCLRVVVQARVMDRHHGTPMLLDGVRCVGAELEYDSEQSDWHGFD